MTISGSVARSGHSSSGRSRQVQRSLSLHIQGKLSNNQSFKDNNKNCSQFGLDSASGQRILPVEMAVSLWQLVFSQVFSIWYFAPVLFTRIAHFEPLVRPKCFTYFLDAVPPPVSQLSAEFSIHCIPSMYLLCSRTSRPC